MLGVYLYMNGKCTYVLAFWFIWFRGIKTFEGWLMPKLSKWKNCNTNIQPFPGIILMCIIGTED